MYRYQMFVSCEQGGLHSACHFLQSSFHICQLKDLVLFGSILIYLDVLNINDVCTVSDIIKFKKCFLIPGYFLQVRLANQLVSQ